MAGNESVHVRVTFTVRNAKNTLKLLRQISAPSEMCRRRVNTTSVGGAFRAPGGSAQQR